MVAAFKVANLALVGVTFYAGAWCSTCSHRMQEFGRYVFMPSLLLWPVPCAAYALYDWNNMRMARNAKFEAEIVAREKALADFKANAAAAGAQQPATEKLK